MSAPIPLVGWDATDDQWREARRYGCSASDVAALLGFDRYRSPWALWAEKTGHPMAPVDDGNPAAHLGSLLEHWLLETGAHVTLGLAGLQFADRLYCHASYPWRLCTPDGYLEGDELIETKTAGLATGRAPGWGDVLIPLGYELQVRWQMHVMDATKCHVVALVAGRGLCHYPITRDLTIEADLVDQVSTWWDRHIIDGNEPPLTGRDAGMVAALYPKVERKTIDLDDTDAMAHWQAYLDARADEAEAAQRKAEAGTALKALLGDAKTGLVGGQPIATWGERKGRIDWESIARELYVLLLDAVNPSPMTIPVAATLPTIEELAEQRRSPGGRTLTIKE